MRHVQAAPICFPNTVHAVRPNRFGGGVPGKQYALIKKDGIPIEQYIARTLDGTFGSECGVLKHGYAFVYTTYTVCNTPNIHVGMSSAPDRPHSESRTWSCNSFAPCAEPFMTRVCAGVAENSHLRSKNYFYYNCLTGKFRRDNCPSYLVEENFKKLKAGVIDGLTVATGTFMDELQARKYTKVRGLRAVAGVGKWKCGKD